MQGATWYYLVGGLQQGPIDTAGLVALIHAGRLPPGALVWRDGMPSWQPWGMFPELVSPLPAGMPAPPAFPPPPAGWQPSGVGGPAAQWPGAYPTGVTYPKAPLGMRFVAMLIDVVLIPMPALIALVVVMVMSSAGRSGEEDYVALGVAGIVTLALFVAAVIYLFIKDGLGAGQSLGKRAMKLMVVHLPSNQPCTKVRSAIRYLVWVGFNFLPYVGWMVEPIIGAADADGRRLGDRAASTQVIAVQDYRSTSALDAIFS